MIEVRRYGARGPAVIVLHGGPGAPGAMAPVARALADDFMVLEPLQRPSGGEPLRAPACASRGSEPKSCRVTWLEPSPFVNTSKRRQAGSLCRAVWLAPSNTTVSTTMLLTKITFRRATRFARCLRSKLVWQTRF